jgi:hypothetical protein
MAARRPAGPAGNASTATVPEDEVTRVVALCAYSASWYIRTMVVRGEPITLKRAKYECRARWERVGYRGGPHAAIVAVGELDDGRWYVDVIGQANRRPRAYATKHDAWVVVQQWMRHFGGEWERIPCYGGIPPDWVGERITVE